MSATKPDAAAIVAGALDALGAAASTEALDAVETETLGKRSAISLAHRQLGSLDPDERRRLGALLQGARAEIEGAIAERRRQLSATERAARLEADRLDLTEVVTASVATSVERGHQHLVTRTRDSLEDTFVAMGFTVAEGP